MVINLKSINMLYEVNDQRLQTLLHRVQVSGLVFAMKSEFSALSQEN